MSPSPESDGPSVAPDAPWTTAPDVAEDVLRIELQPLTVEAGSEVIRCEYFEPLAEDVWVSGYDSYQGLGGHHLVLYRALKPKAPGTVEDCSGADSMTNAMVVMSPTVTASRGHATATFPDDTALRLPAGIQLIAQAHYINSSAETQTHTDVADLHSLPIEEGEARRQLHIYATAPTAFTVPPGQALSLGYDCTYPFDMTFVHVLPHMHEYGSRFEILVGPAGAMDMMLEVEQWTPEMRDLPPSRTFYEPSQRATGHHAKGELQRTTCTWLNTSDKPLVFPEEMCATLAYFYSDDPGAKDTICAGQ